MTEKVDRQWGTQLQGTTLWTTRAVWMALVALILGMFVSESIRLVQTPVRICDSLDCTFSPAMAATIQNAGISLNFAGLFSTALFNIALPTGFIIVAALIIWRRSDDWMGLLVSFLLIFLGAYEFPGVNQVFSLRPGWTLITAVLSTFGLLALPLLIYVFPNGRFVPGWGRWPLLVALLLWLAGDFFLPADANETLSNVLFFVVVIPGLVGQVYRYRRLSTPVERQQTKWAVVGLVGPIFTLVIWLTLFVPADSFAPWMQLALAFAIQPVATLLALLMPISLAISILRYRLWDIDVVIRRTLIYGVVSALLALVFFGGVAVLQSLFSAVTGEQSSLAIVMSTLAIAALFTPLRNRVQGFVDRRFFRQKYDAQKALERFSEAVRDEIDPEGIRVELLAVVGATIQPDHVSVWLAQSQE